MQNYNLSSMYKAFDGQQHDERKKNNNLLHIKRFNNSLEQKAQGIIGRTTTTQTSQHK